MNASTELGLDRKRQFWQSPPHQLLAKIAFDEINLPDAVRIFRLLLKKWPEEIFAWYFLGVVLMDLRKFDEDFVTTEDPSYRDGEEAIPCASCYTPALNGFLCDGMHFLCTACHPNCPICRRY